MEINEATGKKKKRKKKNLKYAATGRSKGKKFCLFSKPASIKLRFKNKSVKASAATLLQTAGIFHKNSYRKYLLNMHLKTRHGSFGGSGETADLARKGPPKVSGGDEWRGRDVSQLSPSRSCTAHLSFYVLRGRGSSCQARGIELPFLLAAAAKYWMAPSSRETCTCLYLGHRRIGGGPLHQAVHIGLG